MDEGFQFILTNLDKIGMGSGVVSAGAYLIYKKISEDKKIDDIEVKSQALIDNVTNQLHTERKENMDLRNAIERVAIERNEAVQDLGKLQGEVQSLETQVNLLTIQVRKLEEENKKLSIEIRSMHLHMIECFNHFNKHMDEACAASATPATPATPTPATPATPAPFVPRFIGDKPA